MTGPASVPFSVWEQLLEAHPAVMLVIDPADGRITHANAAAQRYYGWSLEELRARTIHEVNTLSEAEVALEMRRAAAAGRNRFAFRHRRADGAIRDVHVTSGPVRLRNGNGAVVDRLVSVIHDVGDLAGIHDQLRLRDRALEVAQDALVVADRSGRIVWSNPAFTAMTGYEASEATGRTPGELVASGRHDPAFYRRMWATLLRGETWRGQLRNRRKDGTPYDDETVITPVADPSGEVTHYVAVKRDVSHRVRRQDELEMWEAVFRNVGAGVVVADPDGTLRLVNPAYAAMHGVEADALIGRSVHELYAPHDLPKLRRALRTVERDAHHVYEADHQRADGTVFPVSVDLTWTRLARRPALIATVQDRSAVRRLESDLRRARDTDPLTGLPNREGLRRAAAATTARHDRVGAGYAVAFAGLDGFRAVNDSYGHEVGDEVLREVARRFTTTLRTGDTLGRFAGDAFALLIVDMIAPEHAERVARRLQATLTAPIVVDGTSIAITASIGLALAPDDGVAIEALLSHAEAAMHAAKARGSGGVRYFDPSLQAAAEDRLTLRTELAAAIGRDQLWLAYQPLVDLRSGRPVGCEALVRWDHPTLGAVSPGRFVPVAERTGQIVAIGRFVRRRALSDLKGWDAAGATVPRVAVNLSAIELADPRLADTVMADLKEADVAPERLEVEVTESAVLSDEASALETLRRLRAHGVRIAIDDFGTGFASLAYLRKVPAHVLKLDGSFVRDLDVTEDASHRTLAAAVADLGEAFAMTVVGEGVETETQEEALRRLGFAVGQGWRFARPMPYDGFLAWWRDRA